MHHRGGNLRSVVQFFLHSSLQGSLTFSIKAATAAATAAIPPVHSQANGILGSTLSPVAILFGLVLPFAACLFLGISRRSTLCTSAAIATAASWILAVWSVFHLNGPTFSYLLAWAALTPVPCWIALAVTIFQATASRKFVAPIVMSLSVTLGIVCGFAGPSFTALNDPQVLKTTQLFTHAWPKTECAMFSTNRRDIPTFSFLAGIANELDRIHVRVKLQNHPVETTFSQFAPTVACGYSVKFLTARPGDHLKSGYLQTTEGVSIFLARIPGAI
jgi:hypothetical protein